MLKPASVLILTKPLTLTRYMLTKAIVATLVHLRLKVWG